MWLLHPDTFIWMPYAREFPFRKVLRINFVFRSAASSNWKPNQARPCSRVKCHRASRRWLGTRCLGRCFWKRWKVSCLWSALREKSSLSRTRWVSLRDSRATTSSARASTTFCTTATTRASVQACCPWPWAGKTRRAAALSVAACWSSRPTSKTKPWRRSSSVCPNTKPCRSRQCWFPSREVRANQNKKGEGGGVTFYLKNAVTFDLIEVQTSNLDENVGLKNFYNFYIYKIDIV